MSNQTRIRALIGALAGLLAGAALVPAGAAAHGLVGRADLPIPEWLFGWAAAVVLVISFVGLAVLWPRPRLQDPAHRKLFTIPVWVEVPVGILCGLFGLFAFAVVVWAGLTGTETPTANLAPTVVYVAFWVGVPVLSFLFGDIFRPFNPWLALARGVAFVAGRVAPRGLPSPIPYPDWLGRWPAAIGIAAFVWVELIYRNGDQPRTLAILALAYFAVQLVGMSLFGIKAWSERADAFGVYFNLFAHMSALYRRGRDLCLRAPFAGVTQLPIVPGTVALILVVIGTTTFDGASEGPVWLAISPDIQQGLIDIGLSPAFSLELTFTLGLLLAIGIVSGLYWLGCAGMRTVERDVDVKHLAREFAHTLVPIAFAYVLAHYFSLLVYQGQALGFLISDPLGNESDYLGTRDWEINYEVINATAIWYVQVGALVVGHVAGLVLAHDKALALFKNVREATRSQYFMLAVMIAFTSLGLWLLSGANE
jgi:hypothetical protein